MKRVLTFLLLLSLTSLGAQKDEQLIRRILAEQTAHWNKGDIEGFMNGYWKSDSLLFVGMNGPKYGYQTTLSNYKKNYPDTAAMGKLHFDILKIQSLLPDHCFVLGKWALTRSVGNVSGYFTLIFHKIKGQWMIISDHSS